MNQITDWQTRTRLLFDNQTLAKFAESNVLVIGLGGVGAYVAENIARAGIGKITIADGENTEITNLNRQLLALHNSLGDSKTEIMGRRIKNINPEIKLNEINEFISEDKMQNIINADFDYIVDAIDTLAPKLKLAEICVNKKIPLVSSMGAGGKIDPAAVKISDLSESFNCKLAKAMRKRLHKIGIKTGFKVVFSSEKNKKSAVQLVDNKTNQRSIVGTVSYMPALFGCFCASAVIKDIAQK